MIEEEESGEERLSKRQKKLVGTSNESIERDCLNCEHSWSDETEALLVIDGHPRAVEDGIRTELSEQQRIVAVDLDEEANAATSLVEMPRIAGQRLRAGGTTECTRIEKRKKKRQLTEWSTCSWP